MCLIRACPCAGTRELLQSDNSQGRSAKARDGSPISDMATVTEDEVAGCTACQGTCATCDSMSITAGVTIDESTCAWTGTGDNAKYACDVYVSNALLDWKAADDGISWLRITPGACGDGGVCQKLVFARIAGPC